MTGIFLAVLIVVAIIGIGIALTGPAWPFRAFADLGRTGTWFHHPEMDPPEAQPDPHANDPAIEHRPIRGRRRA